MGASRRRDVLDFKPGAWRHVQAPVRNHADWRTLYDQQYNQLAQDFDKLQRMDQSSHQLDAMRYQMQAQQAHAARHQQMAVGKYYKGWSGTSGTSSLSGTAVTPAEAKKEQYWDRRYNVAESREVRRLNKGKVYGRLMEMARRKGPCYYALRENQAVFDGEFGKGAWKAYTATKKQPKTGKPVPAPLSRLVPWRVRPFIVEGGKTLAQQLEKDRSDSMARASKKFYVGYNETLLEALQREFDVWTTGISIRAAKPGEFTVTSGTGITFG